MKKKDSWDSEFRKKRFYERQSRKALKKEIESRKGSSSKEIERVPSSIAIMLDLDGTADNIDDIKAQKFMTQLEYLIKNFNVDYGTISISTYYRTGAVMTDVLEVLNRNLTDNVKLGFNFFYGGTYDYLQDVEIMRHPEFNSDKVETFTSYYDNSRWMAIIDDGVASDTYKKYQDKRAMLFCRPSQDESDISDNNFMSIGTTTKGFDGVLEVLDQYIESIKDLDTWDISWKQRMMITHVSSLELVNKIRSRDYYFLNRYFSEGYADDADYKTALEWLFVFNDEKIDDELVELFDLITSNSKVEVNDEILLKVKAFKNR